MITVVISAYVLQADLNEEALKKIKEEKGKLDVWLINPGAYYSEVQIEFQKPDIIHHITDTQLNNLVKLLGYSPETGQGKDALASVFGEATKILDK